MSQFTITWQTSLGRFGWTEIQDCKEIDDALEAFNALRHDDGSRVPFDACIDVVKKDC
jgi:hypothetical protein|tara:strand:- start:12 stop:185 length:174 start_codon:yes stop_codon:yes gene_type:complete